MDMRRLVRKLRIAASMTQEQFAERSGFSQQYISGLEQRQRNPTVVTLFELAAALDATPVQLLEPDVSPAT